MATGNTTCQRRRGACKNYSNPSEPKASRTYSSDALRISSLLQKEDTLNYHNVEAICELDFDFHHLIALASGNNIYPLLLNSFKHCYANLAGQFFSDPTVVPVVFDFHKKMVKAIKDKNEKSATRIMRRMLDHGAENLKLNS